MKRARRPPPELVANGKIVSLEPAILPVAAAALYCGVSASLFNAYRARDVKALREGGALIGPKWVVLQRSMVRYRKESLDEWLRANAAELAVVESRRRAPTEEPAE